MWQDYERQRQHDRAFNEISSMEVALLQTRVREGKYQFPDLDQPSASDPAQESGA